MVPPISATTASPMSWESKPGASFSVERWPMALGAGFVPARKPGKLPWERASESYDLEYGSDALEAHRDCLDPRQPGPRGGRRAGHRWDGSCRGTAGTWPGRRTGRVELPARDRGAGRAGTPRRCALSGDRTPVVGSGRSGRGCTRPVRQCHFSEFRTGSGQCHRACRGAPGRGSASENVP